MGMLRTSDQALPFSALGLPLDTRTTYGQLPPVAGTELHAESRLMRTGNDFTAKSPRSKCWLSATSNSGPAVSSYCSAKATTRYLPGWSG
jgi:hypothetical protein